MVTPAFQGAPDRGGVFEGADDERHPERVRDVGLPAVDDLVQERLGGFGGASLGFVRVTRSGDLLRHVLEILEVTVPLERGERVELLDHRPGFRFRRPFRERPRFRGRGPPKAPFAGHDPQTDRPPFAARDGLGFALEHAYARLRCGRCLIDPHGGDGRNRLSTFIANNGVERTAPPPFDVRPMNLAGERDVVGVEENRPPRFPFADPTDHVSDRRPQSTVIDRDKLYRGLGVCGERFQERIHAGFAVLIDTERQEIGRWCAPHHGSAIAPPPTVFGHQPHAGSAERPLGRSRSHELALGERHHRNFRGRIAKGFLARAHFVNDPLVLPNPALE